MLCTFICWLFATLAAKIEKSNKDAIMQKEMKEIAVSTTEDMIVIESNDPPDGPNNKIHYNCISIAPEQADILIQWLKEAKNELMNE